MNPLPVFEKAEAYLNVHLGHTGPGGAIKAPGPFVTLSRESGAGGSAVARAIVAQLHEPDPRAPHWAVYSANLIDEMLLSAGLPPRLARFLPEDRTSEIQATIGEIIGLHPNLWSLIDKTNELIRRLARDGHAIFLGRGANFATASIPNGVHVRLVAPVAIRAERTARWLGVDPTTAAMHNSRRDAARARYVQSNFNTDVASPSEYDLVINTGTIPAETAGEIIAGFVRAHTTATMSTAPAATAGSAASATPVSLR
ncbi:cytidylate kinase-like family protein [Opitutus sp. ER46]|uniref:cytidylate kinase-like family protein n=1 Tax=Opitutus sp. ER46 TaxID=2161864 RepID=UPI0013049B8A|nr:cytidylate kinase-like family protein [Opitutus sp. ER46]